MNSKQWLLCSMLLAGSIGMSGGFTASAFIPQEASKTQAGKIYVFSAVTALPQRGNNVQLSPGFVLKITPDSLICYLPYYGRAYQASYGDNANAMNFTSVKFRTHESRTKKGVQTLTFSLEDNREVRTLYVTILGDGYASVSASFNQRQPISYRGQISIQP